MRLRQQAVAALLLGIQLAIVSCSQTKSFAITSTVQNHFAVTTMESEVLNDEETSAEVGFQIMLPNEAFITHFEMMINGVTYAGVIEEKQKAKQKFNEAKRRGKTAGLVETRQKAEKIFSTSVNVGANTTVHFKLVYQQLLRKLGGRYKNKIVLFGDQLAEYLSIDVYICETRNLQNVTVPPIRLNRNQGTVPADASIRVDRNTAQVSFVGNNRYLARAQSANGGVFTVEYQLESSANPTEVVVEDGYFMYFGPDIEFTPKSVIFVTDDSGSMSGRKSAQVKKAMGNILSKLLPSDMFGILKFSSSTRAWRNNLVEATPENIKPAQQFVKGRDESGGTEIWKALKAALKIMDSAITRFELEPDPTSNMIILLSDGEGSLSNDQVLKNVQELNLKRVAIHTISFGEGADDQLLKALAAENDGRWKKILVDLDSALQIENYVDEIRAGEAAKIQVVKYPEVVAESFSVGGFGGEVMSVGKFQKEIELYSKGPHTIKFEGATDGEVSVLTASFFLDQKNTKCGGMGVNQIQNFVAKSYAMAKVEKALKDLEAATDPEEKALYKEKAINVSMKYKLVTPVTSLLVIKPEQNDEESKEENAETTTTTPATTTTTTTTQLPVDFDLPGGGLSKLLHSASSNARSGAGRWSFHSDPHFLARLSDDITVCFDWLGRDNEVVNMFHDIDKSIVINGLIRGNGKAKTTQQLFVTKLAFLLPRDDLFVEIDTGKYVVGSMLASSEDADRVEISLRDIERRSHVFGIMKFHVAQIKRNHIVLNVRIRKVLFVVEIHNRNGSKLGSRDHLDLMIPTYDHTARNLGGIFGHLQMGNIFDGGEDARIKRDEKRNKSFLMYNNDKIEVRKRQMKIPLMRSTVDCWFSKGHLQHLLGSKLNAFKLTSLQEIPRAA